LRQLFLLVFFFCEHHITGGLDLAHEGHFLGLRLLPGGFELGEATLGSAFDFVLFDRLNGVINATEILCSLLLELFFDFILGLLNNFFADFYAHAQHFFLFDLSVSEFCGHFPILPLLYFEQLEIHLSIAGLQNAPVLNTYFQDDNHGLANEVHQR
jgi:hypothetical protein